MVVHLRWRRDWYTAVLRQEAHLVLRGRRYGLELVWVVLGVPIRYQLVQRRWLDHVAGYNVVTKLAGLLEQEYSKVLIPSFVRKLLELDGGTEACWPATDDTDIDLVTLPFDRVGIEAVIHRGKLPSCSSGECSPLSCSYRRWSVAAHETS